MRRLGYVEGEEHLVEQSGTVSSLRLSMWHAGGDGSVRVELVRHCPPGVYVTLREAFLSPADLPPYEFVSSSRTDVEVPLDPPVQVEPGDMFTVRLTAESVTVVTGIWRNDPYPAGRFVSDDPVPDNWELWDMAAALVLHP